MDDLIVPRREAANKFMKEFDFGKRKSPSEVCGWSITAPNSWQRVIFFDDPLTNRRTSGNFYIVFKANSVEIEDGDYALE